MPNILEPSFDTFSLFRTQFVPNRLLHSSLLIGYQIQKEKKKTNKIKFCSSKLNGKNIQNKIWSHIRSEKKEKNYRNKNKSDFIAFVSCWMHSLVKYSVII